MRKTYVITSFETAIALLRPGAMYQLSGANFSQWNDPRPMPSLQEIQDTMYKIKEFEDRIPCIELE